MEQVYDNSELYHHGILGQKWGVRRFQNPDGSLTPEGRERYSSDNKERSVVSRVKQGAHDLAVKRAVKTGKGLSVLSDDELRDALNRRSTELNYKRTMDSLNPKKVNKGKQLLADAVERTGRNILYKLGDKLVDKIFKDEDDELEDEVRRESNLARLRGLKEDSEAYEDEKSIRELQRASRKRSAQDDADAYEDEKYIRDRQRESRKRSADEDASTYDDEKYIRDKQREARRAQADEEEALRDVKQLITRNNLRKDEIASELSRIVYEQLEEEMPAWNNAVGVMRKDALNDWTRTYLKYPDNPVMREIATEELKTRLQNINAANAAFRTRDGGGKK